MPSFGTIIWWAGGGLLFLGIWKAGLAMLKSMTSPTPPPPPPGEMRRINVRDRCRVCGVELKMTMAPDEDPPPPQHSVEEMDMIAPIMV